MAKHIVKCKYCGIQFDANVEPFVEVGGRRYAHKACADKHNASLSKDEVDYNNLEQYIKKIFGMKVLNAKIKKQIKDFHQEYSYSYSGMQKTLYWWYEVKKNSIEQAQGGIGIVPYVYNNALDYFYTIYLAKMSNEDIKIIQPKTQEVTIESPRVRITPPKLFDIEGGIKNNE